MKNKLYFNTLEVLKTNSYNVDKKNKIITGSYENDITGNFVTVMPVDSEKIVIRKNYDFKTFTIKNGSDLKILDLDLAVENCDKIFSEDFSK